jgi:hypothetical protein
LINYIKSISSFISYINLCQEFYFFSNKESSINKLQFNSKINDILDIFKSYDNFNYILLLKILELDENITIHKLFSLDIKNDDKYDIKKLEIIIRLFILEIKPKQIKAIELFLNTLKKDIFYKILQIRNLYIKINSKNINYITIPQYTNICWYISLITGIAYSDLSKQLIYSKHKHERIFDNKFKEMIMYIINNITKDYKEYDYTNYDLFEYLKKTPIKILNNIILNVLTFFLNDFTNKDLVKINNNIIYFSNNKIKNEFLEYIKKFKYTRYSYFVRFFNKNINDNKINLNTTSEYGLLHKTENHIILYLYNLLDIKIKYFYVNSIDDNLLFFKSKIETDDDNPDTIILEYNNENIYYQDYYEQIFLPINRHDIANGIITYNGNNYKLDYILHHDNHKECKFDIGCGHCIVGISYNNIEYIYDSATLFKKIDDIYDIPCSLIKQKWSKDINKDITYCTYDCKYNLECKIDDNRTNFCYTFNNDIIYIYVKI